MNDIAIDLGTATVLVYVKGKGVVFEEPSVVAVDKASGKVLKVGKEAELMLGRTPGNILAVRPLQDGVISQYEITLKMLKYFLRKATGPSIFKPRVMVCVPSGITEVEERAVYDATIAAGAKKTYLIEEPLAAAIGAGIDISKPEGHMVVDIGGGTTDIAVISLGSIVASDSLKLAGDKIDEAIIKYIRRKHNVLIGEVTAEEIKKKIGGAWPFDNEYVMNVKGRCLKEGLPKMISISSEEVREAVLPVAKAIADGVCHVLERTPPELIGDLGVNGMILSGGGSLLYGIDRMIEDSTHIRTMIVDDPLACAAHGAGKLLTKLDSMQDGMMNFLRNREMRN